MCFDPLHNRMYTTTNCDFFEQIYYYSQFSPQRERVSDDLSWLIYPFVSNPDPKEQVGETIEVVTKDIVSLVLTTPVLQHHLPQEEVIPNPQEVSDNKIDHVVIDDVPNRYKLRLRSIRGTPQGDMIPNLRHKDREI